MKRWQIALLVAVPALAAAGVFFAHEANLFPVETRRVKSFDDVEKIWGAGGYLCARGHGGVQCAVPGLRAGDVENAISVPFLRDPVAFAEAAPFVCALERGEVLCWDMASPILSGLGLVYSPAQRAAGTIRHGALEREGVWRLPVKGEARALVQHFNLFCAVADDGATCFKHTSGDDARPTPVWNQPAQRMVRSSDGQLLCIDEGSALLCYEAPTSGAPPSPAMRIAGAADATTVSTTYSSVCVLRPAGVECGERPRSRDESVLQEVRVAPVSGLRKPAQLWGTWSRFFALDGDDVMMWEDRGAPAPSKWAALRPGDGVYSVTSEWFWYEGGILKRTPDGPWPRRYAFGSKPSQVVSVGIETCALAGGQAFCFDY